MREHSGANAATPSGGRWLHRYLIKQFGRPSGFVGRLAGWSMARRPSNRQRNQWTVDLLRLTPGDRVLEIGLALVSRYATRPNKSARLVTSSVLTLPKSWLPTRDDETERRSLKGG
jgi:hypothetical protein